MSSPEDSPEHDAAVEALPHQLGLGPVGKGITAASGAAIAAAFPPASVPLAGLVEFLHSFGAKLQDVQMKQVNRVMDAAGEQAGISVEEVAERLLEREDFILLTAEAVDSARRTRLSGKPDALGRSLGRALSDDALIDPETIWVRILSIVEPPHMRVIGMFLTQDYELFLKHLDAFLASSGRLDEPFETTLLLMKNMSFSIRKIGETVGLGDIVMTLITDLVGAGLLVMENDQVPGGDPMEQRVRGTSLALELAQRLSQQAPAK